MAYRSLDVEEYKKWDEKHHEARYDLYKPFVSICKQVGPLAQSVERRADNAKVVSSRLTRTTFSLFPCSTSLDDRQEKLAEVSFRLKFNSCKVT